MTNRWKNLQTWQKKDFLFWLFLLVFICVIFVGYAMNTMFKEKEKASTEFEQVSQEKNEEAEALVNEFSQNATSVLCGTYVETIKDVSIKDNTFRVVFTAWFKWEEAEDKELEFLSAEAFRIYNGSINRKETIKDYNKKGVRYQEMRVDATVSKKYNTVRFPLGSHLLKFYIEPKYTVDKVLLKADTQSSGINSNLNISGYELTRHGVLEHIIEYPNTMGNPKFTKPQLNSELLTCLEINRNSWGLYMKCFIALIGTTAWVLIMVYICANHRVNPLGTIPSALFGTVSNIMVGSNLLSDVSDLGLVEYVNMYGIFILLTGAFCIIHINRIRDIKVSDSEIKQGNAEYAKFFGKVIFYAMLICGIIGHALIPISAYMWRSGV